MNEEDLAGIDLDRFFIIESVGDKRGSNLKRLVEVVKQFDENQRRSIEEGRFDKNGNPKHRGKLTAGVVKRLCKEFYMEHNDELLSANGSDLDALASHFDIDPNLPLIEKQELVVGAMSGQKDDEEEKWTPARIAKYKARFLDELESVHFPSIVCKTLGIKFRMYRHWFRTDPEFAESVRTAQKRTAERIAGMLIHKSMEGDVTALMFALKQFEGIVDYVEKETTEAETSGADVQLENLTPEEQSTLLTLLRKARGGDEFAEMVFIEDETPEEHPALEAPEGEYSDKTEFIETDDDLEQDEIIEVKGEEPPKIIDYHEGD